MGAEYREDDPILSKTETTDYRAAVARINFLSIDRPDLLYACKEAARRMAAPRKSDWDKIFRIARYLKGKPRLRLWYRYQAEEEMVATYSDRDWAGCKRTRRSTTGGVMMKGNHYIKGWSTTQATVTLSSAEAELFAAVRASAETIGMISLLKDFNIHARGTVLADASAALGVIRRRGVGKLRHVHTNYLWVQQKSASNEIKYDKVVGVHNVADMMTKPLNSDNIMRHTSGIGGDFPEDIDETQLTIHHIGEVNADKEKEIADAARRVGLTGNLRAWTRIDMASRTMRTTARRGPDWSKVRMRYTSSKDRKHLRIIEHARDICRNKEHALLSCGPVDLETTLVYDASQDKQ